MLLDLEAQMGGLLPDPSRLPILPTALPKEWNDGALKQAKAHAGIITKRLEVFK